MYTHTHTHVSLETPRADTPRLEGTSADCVFMLYVEIEIITMNILD